ncbi:hypothetical protein HU200_010255 [Digitaria exilis]|uniref:Uncharacterized protein n=1 Tax=Digitaria exilis TaxID=1010633 RepID=A0A835FHF4_9POAL|nr:hypothetical protein HU200_010255 [Digitaria exilis]
MAHTSVTDGVPETATLTLGHFEKGGEPSRPLEAPPLHLKASSSILGLVFSSPSNPNPSESERERTSRASNPSVRSSHGSTPAARRLPAPPAPAPAPRAAAAADAARYGPSLPRSPSSPLRAQIAGGSHLTRVPSHLSSVDEEGGEPDARVHLRDPPNAMRASISALPSPARFDPSPARASMAAALRPPATRAKLDFPAAEASPAEKENLLPAAAPASPMSWAGAAAGKEDLLSPAGADAHDELVALNLAAVASAAGTPGTGPLFVRGRLYDLYSARRNERLKRKHGSPFAALDPEQMAEDPCVAVELSKRRGAKKAYATTGAESVRKSMPAADFGAGRAVSMGPRSSLRSSKEMKKASAASGTASLAVKERRVNSRSSTRRI